MSDLGSAFPQIVIERQRPAFETEEIEHVSNETAALYEVIPTSQRTLDLVFNNLAAISEYQNTQFHWSCIQTLHDLAERYLR